MSKDLFQLPPTSSIKSPEYTEPAGVIHRASSSHITVQIQQSHSSSPQSQPKQGFDTDLIGFLIELPEPLEGRVQFNGVETEATIVMSWRMYIAGK